MSLRSSACACDGLHHDHPRRRGRSFRCSRRAGDPSIQPPPHTPPSALPRSLLVNLPAPTLHLHVFCCCPACVPWLCFAVVPASKRLVLCSAVLFVLRRQCIVAVIAGRCCRPLLLCVSSASDWLAAVLLLSSSPPPPLLACP
ncbi:hypothetical protein PTSG_12786 [Salpingoeca rosetta]|uniref:Uncharacterized protein n=1 Tax=Salpingoeca rosetta (strain ATCC 50818 / BSB-021) TaxID=946362 RepID=F2UKK7_SALR5|nr:uncharacterized protein PTSG_12786 [Salpingoeca rosetta]EGD77656.1 hypothetical protein PTSG_12786 [Salpingoeca rosetta]|eukprot:XP_004990132.1 hypothetical protein PTSG_12786 [Salpingoeca rosetta]